MRLVDLSSNDTTSDIALKSNMNFKNLSYELSQLIKRGLTMSSQAVREALVEIVDDVIPAEVTEQINDADISGMVATAVTNADIPGQVSTAVTNADIPSQVSTAVTNADIPGQVSTAITNADIPGIVADEITAADIPGQVGDAVATMLDSEIMTTVSDFFTAGSCSNVSGMAVRWGNIAFISLTYQITSSISVSSNGKISSPITIGTLNIGWRPAASTNIIIDGTFSVIGDVDTSGAIKTRSANGRSSSYTISYGETFSTSMMLMLGIQ